MHGGRMPEKETSQERPEQPESYYYPAHEQGEEWKLPHMAVKDDLLERVTMQLSTLHAKKAELEQQKAEQEQQLRNLDREIQRYKERINEIRREKEKLDKKLREKLVKTLF
jgi:chromosome segregation ATPase